MTTNERYDMTAAYQDMTDQEVHAYWAVHAEMPPGYPLGASKRRTEANRKETVTVNGQTYEVSPDTAQMIADLAADPSRWSIKDCATGEYVF